MIADLSNDRGASVRGTSPATRRDFIYVAAATVGTIGAALAVWPFLDQMNPDASTLAMTASEVDVSGIAAGASITVKWRGRPVFIRHRTEHEIELAKAVAIGALLDPLARNADLPQDAPATDENRASRAEWLVTVGICTHLGCVPLGYQGEYGGYFCPCHGSLYDTAGRVRRGPAPENLHIPPTEWMSETLIRIG
jgi:ubiquinol-cytochrome c reductase iron-sulfur subunit